MRPARWTRRPTGSSSSTTGSSRGDGAGRRMPWGPRTSATRGPANPARTARTARRMTRTRRPGGRRARRGRNRPASGERRDLRCLGRGEPDHARTRRGQDRLPERRCRPEGTVRARGPSAHDGAFGGGAGRSVPAVSWPWRVRGASVSGHGTAGGCRGAGREQCVRLVSPGRPRRGRGPASTREEINARYREAWESAVASGDSGAFARLRETRFARPDDGVPIVLRR